MIPILTSATHDFQMLKIYLLDFTGLDRDALHLHAGLAIFVLTRLIWRRRGGWVVAWLVALLLAVGVEWLDIRAEGQVGTPQPEPAHWHDVWNTMIWPTVLLFVGQWLQPGANSESAQSGDFTDQAFKEPAAI